MRRTLDQLLTAPGLTRGRFIALTLVSLLATATVVAAGVRHHRTPWELVAAAHSRPASVVEVTPRRPVAAAPVSLAPTVDDAVGGAAADPAPAAADVPLPSAATSPPLPSTPTAPPKTETGAQTAPKPAKPVSKVKHLFLINASGTPYDATQASYLDGTLKPLGRVLAGYRSLAEGELATEVALVSGQKPTPGIAQGCSTYGGDCLFPIETLTLSDQFVSKGQRWRGYFGAMPAACTHPSLNSPDTSSGDYVTQRNPFVYFHSLTELGECATNDLPLDSLDADLATATATPNFAYVAPPTCSDFACTDAFLSQVAPKILDSAAYKADGALVVLFGSGDNSGALLSSQFAQPGTTSDTSYDAYSVLRTIEDLFGLDYLGGAGDSTVKSFATTEIAAGLPNPA
jgi:hypothetical protein